MNNDKRIADFISVASVRRDANPKLWDYIHDQLIQLLDNDSRLKLDKAYTMIRNKNALTKWDEMFLENTIDESKLAERIAAEDTTDAYQKLYDQHLMQQRLAMQNVSNPHTSNPYTTYSTTSTTASGVYPTATNNPTFFDRLLGR